MILPSYTPGEPVGLHHILSDWVKERSLPVDIFWNPEALSDPTEGRWMLVGEENLTAEIDGPLVIGWSAEFVLNAADPGFLEKLETVITDAEKE